MECLDHIIGVSRTECECLEVGIDPADRQSKSGIYLDEVEGGLKLTALEKIDCQTFVEKAKQAIKRAKDMFIEQILAAYYSSSYKPAFKNFKGKIGKKNHIRPLTNLKQYAGLALKLNYIRGANLTVKRIGLILSQESDVGVYVYRSYGSGGEIEQVSVIEGIPTIANIASIKELETPLVLPFHDEYDQPIRYYFVYDTAINGFPRDNQAGCNCGGMDSILKSYLKPGGISVSNVQDMNTDKLSEYANGIFLDGEISCSSRSMVCNLLAIDESNTIAHAIAYKGQELLIEDLMGSGNINQYTMLSKDYLWGKRNHFRKEFDDRVLWLSQAKPMELVSDCLVCEDGRMVKALIR